MPEAWATAIRRGALVVIHPNSRDGARGLVATPPYITLPRSASLAEIGKAARSALDQSRASVDMAVDPNERLKAIYRALDVNSEHELAWYAQLVGLKRAHGTLVVTPTENGGELREWNFLHLADQRIAIPDEASNHQIGEAIRSGFDMCRASFESRAVPPPIDGRH